MPEKLVMHPDMTDEEWGRWDCVLSELSKTTSLAPFCSGISTERQSKSDVPPYEYDTLKTNDQVNRDAASGVPTSIPATTAAPVQRIVRRFAALFCEYATAKRVNTANKLCNLGYVVVGASGVNQTKGADGIYCPDVGDRVWNILLKNRSSFACWFTNKVMKRFFKAPIGTSGRPFNADRY